MTSSGSVWVWVSRGGRDRDRLDVSLEDGGGAGMAKVQRDQSFGRNLEQRGLTLRLVRTGWTLVNGS